MTFVDRSYGDVVRDVLTNLTKGVTGEVHRVEYDPTARPLQVPDIVLMDRPVRRVSLIEGKVAGATPDADPQPYVFGLNDYALVPDATNSANLNTIRFLPFGRKPVPDTDIRVNYYPRTADPTPLTDLNVGSVVRTIVEAMSTELAVLYAQLNLAYDSAFVETATGRSLDRVVALLGLRRYRAGRPVGTVQFSRRPGSLGNITIPPGTPVTDTEDKLRYETIETHVLLAGESVAQVRVRGASDLTPPVEPGKLRVIQRAIAGIDAVTNERPTTAATQDETDDELRTRAGGALLASNKGTLGALRFGLLQMPGVRDVRIEEYPNGVPGEVRVSVSLDQSGPGDELPPTIRNRIEDLRPAGIRVISGPAQSVTLQVQAALILEGSHLPAADVEDVHRRARRTLVDLVGRTGVGQRIRTGPLVAALLRGEHIVDAVLTLGPKGGAPGGPGEDFVPEPGAAVSLSEEDVAFAADAYAEPLAPSGEVIAVEVRATVAAQLLAGVPMDAARSQIETRLSQYLGGLSAGQSIDAAAVLVALRDDAKYALDPLRLRLTLTARDEFAQVVQGGPPFQVLPNQTFTVTAVELVP